MDQPLIEFRNVTKGFGGPVILDGVDLTIHRGEVTAIIGKSGGGKSVLLKHIIGLLEQDSGEILFEGRKLSEMTRAEKRSHKRRFSYMFQNNALFDSMTVFENVALPLKEKTKLSPEEIKTKVMDKIDQLELSEVAYKYPSQISGGMQKRVALARALITDPEIVLFDEPTTGLDPLRKNAVLSMIAHYQKRFGFTGIVVSHDIPDIFFISNRVAIIENKKVVFQGHPMDLEQSDSEIVLDFLHSLETLKDELTGLDTMRLFQRRFDAARAEAAQGGQFAIVLLTIERLDFIDQHVGHITAQEIIQTLASYLRHQLKPGDLAARYDNASIVALIHGDSCEKAEERCFEFGKTLKEERVFQARSFGKVCPSYCVSAGAAEGKPSASLEELVHEAKASQIIIACLQCGGRESLT